MTKLLYIVHTKIYTFINPTEKNTQQENAQRLYVDNYKIKKKTQMTKKL